MPDALGERKAKGKVKVKLHKWDLGASIRAFPLINHLSSCGVRTVLLLTADLWMCWKWNQNCTFEFVAPTAGENSRGTWFPYSSQKYILQFSCEEKIQSLTPGQRPCAPIGQEYAFMHNNTCVIVVHVYLRAQRAEVTHDKRMYFLSLLSVFLSHPHFHVPSPSPSCTVVSQLSCRNVV